MSDLAFDQQANGLALADGRANLIALNARADVALAVDDHGAFQGLAIVRQVLVAVDVGDPRDAVNAVPVVAGECGDFVSHMRGSGSVGRTAAASREPASPRRSCVATFYQRLPPDATAVQSIALRGCALYLPKASCGCRRRQSSLHGQLAETPRPVLVT